MNIFEAVPFGAPIDPIQRDVGLPIAMVAIDVLYQPYIFMTVSKVTGIIIYLIDR